MLLIRKQFFVQVNKKLFVSNPHQMAPVTRKRKTSTIVNVDTEPINHKKLSMKVLPSKAQLADVNKQKSTSTIINTGKDGLPILAFSSENELESWLQSNHNVNTGLWVKIAKKSSGIPTVTYDKMLDAALCYGWIDGQRSGLDETWFLQRITPRQSKSTWSQINREKVKRLIRMGRMQSAGQRQIDEAKADGRWDNAYKPTSGFIVPDELAAALEKSSPKAIELFKTMGKPDKSFLINRLEQATSEGDRSECIKSIVSMLERGETNVKS